MIAGVGTAINAGAVLIGTTVGVVFGGRMSDGTRRTVTDGLGLVVGVAAVASTISIADPSLTSAVGKGWPTLIVLLALVIGGVIGSALKIERRLQLLGESLQRRFAKEGESTFVEGFVVASLVFCVGPLAILGSISDGLGAGIDQLVLKSTLDLIASVAFASALGWGVGLSVFSIMIYQGAWTLVGVFAGNIMSDYAIAAMTATGGLLIMAIALRLLRIREIAIGDLLPAIIVAPLLATLIASFRG
ncbi:MAG TPA: DUF554 domain-containing protein [Candidatus Nanopelagicaceae bacterium]|nr:DUF554 domain-containing protein [Candidatus Nanopelagicaceae bacterium]